MNGELIYAYTRAMAIDDGMLVEVPAELAREAGFTVHVALTAGAWHEAVAVPPHLRGLQVVISVVLVTCAWEIGSPIKTTR